MSILRITNVTSELLWLRDLYAELEPGEVNVISRTPAEMADMTGIQQYLAEGKITVDIDLEPFELSAENELTPVYPLGLNWRPSVPNFGDLPVDPAENYLGDARLTLDSFDIWAWNGANWVNTGGGGGPVGPAGGDLTGFYPNPELINQPAVLPGTYGSTHEVPVVTIDAKGRVTGISEVPAGLDLPVTAFENLAAGDVVSILDVASDVNARKVSALYSAPLFGPVGIVLSNAGIGNSTLVRSGGEVSIPAANFDGGLPLGTDVGKRVFLSTVAGRVSLSAPASAGDMILQVGILTAGGATPKVWVRVGEPVVL